jgi:hypothetical protein
MNTHCTQCTGAHPVLGMSRREALGKFGMGLGALALGQLLQADSAHASVKQATALAAPHFAPKAKRVIYLFQSGGPSQLETFDYKPALVMHNGEQLPDSVRGGQRLTGMSANQASLPMAGSIFKFGQHGQSGAWVSELLPHTAKVADELCFIKSMYTEAINHDPAITFLQTGSQLSGRPSIGAWTSYGLGTENENLPAFVVLVTKDQGGQPLYARLWGSGFLPAAYQGVRFRSGKDAVLYLDNPEGVSRESRRKLLDTVNALHHHKLAQDSDPALEARIAQYEMAFRMQQSVPEVTDISGEPQHILDLYGEDVHKPGSYASNCLLARRLAERGVRFIQLYHQGWDHHGNIPGGMRDMTKKTDQGSAALIADLKQRGMLDDTLVIWGGEFGRTNYSQGQLTATDYGRDHHPRCFTMWMAGGGVKPGYTHGATDELGYNVAENGVHVHDFHATLLHLLGIDHERLTYDFQGRAFRLTDVFGNIVNEILA